MPQEVIKKNHMDVAWHEYTDENGENVPVVDSSIAEKASVIGRVGIMFLSCGTGAWRVRSSMNTLAEALGITCTADIGLMSIEYTCYDGEEGFTQSLCLTNTGVNTLKLNRLDIILHYSYVLYPLYPWHVLHMQVCSNWEKYCLGFLFSMRPDISVPCCSSYRDFHSLPVVLTLPNWICVPEWNV